MEARIAQWLVRHRWIAFTTGVVLLAALTLGARSLWFESSYKVFFDAGDPQLMAHEAMEAAYTKADNVAFVVGAPDGETVFTPRTLGALHALTADGWTLPRAIRVDSVTNFQHTRADGDELIVNDLVPDPAAVTPERARELQAIALDEPAVVGLILADDARVASVNVRMELPLDSREVTPATTEIMTAARAMKARYQAAYPELTFHLMGQVVVNHAFNESAESDAGTLVPMMFLAVIVLLGAFLRSAAATAVTTLVVISGIFITVGVAGWLGYQLNQVNISGPIIILTLGVSDCVHVLVHYLRDLRQGMSRDEAMQHALRINLMPVFLTTVTTAIGFFSLNASDSPLFRELGTMVGLGVIGVMAMTLTLLPALMMALPMRIRVQAGDDSRRFSLRGLADHILRHQSAYFFGALAAAASLLMFVPRNDLNDDTVEYFHQELPVRQAFDYVQQNLTGIDSIAYSLPAGAPGGIYDPDYLAAVDQFATWLRAQPEITHVSTFTDILKRLSQNMHGGDPEWYRLPDARDLAAQYILLYELSLPQGLDLANQVTFDKSATKVVAQIANVKAKEIIAIEDRAQAWMAANTPALQTPGAGLSLMFSHIGQNNIKSMIRGSLIALVLISITLMMALRSIKFGLLSLLPNAFPAMMAFGIWGLTVGNVNLAVAAVFSITLGIVVDNTIHFFSKYLVARRERGAEPAEAIRYAFSTVGSALLVTTASLAIGFFILAQSHFDVNASMGLMTAMVIGLALAFDLLFLPGLLLRFDRAPRVSPPDTAPH